MGQRDGKTRTGEKEMGKIIAKMRFDTAKKVSSFSLSLKYGKVQKEDKVEQNLTKSLSNWSIEISDTSKIVAPLVFRPELLKNLQSSVQ